MAVDRGNAAVSKLYDPIQPAVLRLIETTIKNAKKAGIPVGMCGEAAADTRLIPLLCKWGLDEFSVTPSSILHTRKSICECESRRISRILFYIIKQLSPSKAPQNNII